jgi:histidine triad (HIT) family protein
MTQRRAYPAAMAEPNPDHISSAVAPSVFTMIIRGEIPGRFVWRDDEVVAFMTIGPIRPGHTLVVPIEQIDHWTDVPEPLWARICSVQQIVGSALMEAFAPVRVGSIIAGLEVPHCHVHLIPIDSEAELSFANVDPSPDPDALDDAAERIRVALRSAGHGSFVPT